MLERPKLIKYSLFWKHFSDEISDFVFIVHDFSIVWTQEKRN